MTQPEFDLLEPEFEAYVASLRRTWLSHNRPPTQNVLEVMSNWERQEVDRCIKKWRAYITPLAEAWWRQKGLGVIWPEDDSKPVQYYVLDATTP